MNDGSPVSAATLLAVGARIDLASRPLVARLDVESHAPHLAQGAEALSTEDRLDDHRTTQNSA